MNSKSLFKMSALGAFAVLLVVSCWATVESLHLLLPTWPIFLFWPVVVIFFVVASWGTKLITDSLNQSLFIDNRGVRLIGGFIILIVFWVLFFLPTNTHTFFYRASIKDVLTKDLTETKGKLQDLLNEGQAGRIILQEKEDFKAKISVIFSKFAAEVNNPGDLGWAKKAEDVLIQLEGELGELQRLKLKCNSFQCRQELIAAMRAQVESRMESKLKATYDTRLVNINKGLDKPMIQKLIARIEATLAKIDENPTTNNEPTAATLNTLSQSYKLIEKYSDVLIKEFEQKYPKQIESTIKDKKAYAGVSKTERMRSVIDVWGDFFAGMYGGRGFAFWILLAAIIDIAGFISYHMAFAKQDY